MTLSNTSIVLIAKDTEASNPVAELAKSMPGVTLEERNASLSELNGAAQELASQHDLIIFKTQRETDSDVAAVQGIKRQAATGASLLALCDANTTLGDIRRLTRAGVRDVLPDTVTAAELEELIRSWKADANQDLDEADAEMGKVISVAQARGGIGSTTVAVNLADQLLARKGRMKPVPTNSVVIVDLDLQFGAVGSFLDVEPSPALYQMAMDGTEPDATFLEQSVFETESGLSVLSAPAGFAPLDSLRQSQIKALIQNLRTKYDYVVLDLPRALVDWVSPVLEYSDRLYLVTDTTVPSIQQARRLIDFYTEDNLGLQIEIVINHEKKPLVSGRHHTEASKVLERKFRYWLPDDKKAACQAVDCGKPLSQSAARSSLAKAITKIARDFDQETTMATPVRRASK